MEERTQLRAARFEKGLTQEAAAEQIGVDAVTLRRWERGDGLPQPRNQYRICKVYGKTPQELGFSPAPPLPETTTSTPPPLLEEKPQATPQHNVSDCYTAFVKQDLTTRLLSLVWAWCGQQRANVRYQELQALIIRALEQEDSNMQENTAISRRDALRRLASVPIEVYGLSLFGPALLAHPNEVLPQCAAGITACWYLTSGQHLAFVSDTTSRYIPTLKSISVNGSGAQRKDATELLVQALLLKSTMGFMHDDNTTLAINYAGQAAMYSQAAENPMLEATSLRMQAAAYSYANRWDLALQAAEKAKYRLENAQGAPIPSLVCSYVYSGLANYQAYNGQKENALISLEKAHQTFAVRTADVPKCVDHGQANLFTNDGMTHYHLGLYTQALAAFEQTRKLSQGKLGRLEVLMSELSTELSRDDTPRDMERCINLWTQGIQQASKLQSDKWFNEAVQTYKAMRVAWPGEQPIKELQDLLIHW